MSSTTAFADLNNELKDISDKFCNGEVLYEELYVGVRKLSKRMLKFYKMAHNDDDIDNIAHNVATEMYLRAVKDRLPLDSIGYKWNSFLYKNLWRHTRDYYIKDNEEEILVGSADEVVVICHMDNNEYLEFGDLIGNMANRVVLLIEGGMRYRKGSLRRSFLIMSVMATLRFGEVRVIGDIDKSYVKFVANKVRESMRSYMYYWIYKDRESDFSQILLYAEDDLLG